MKPETASWLRKLFLVLVVITDILMLICWKLGGNEVFFWVFIAINISVLIGEVVNNLWGYKKSLSTQVTKTVEEGGKKAFFSVAATVLMALTLVELAFHFLIIGKP